MTTANKTPTEKSRQRSGGPATDAGKAVASQNALRHGCTAERLTLPGEDEAGVQALVRSAEQAVGLPGEIGHAIAEQLVQGIQREERIRKVEEALVKDAIAMAEDRSNYPEDEIIRHLTKLRDGCREIKQVVDPLVDNPPEDRPAEKLTALLKALHEIASIAPAENRSTQVAIDSVLGLLRVRLTMRGDLDDLFAKAAQVVDSHLAYVEGLLAEQNTRLEDKIELTKTKASIPDLKDLKRLDKYRTMSENSVLRKLKILGAMKELSAPSE